MYTHAEEYESALSAYQDAGNWRMALCAAARLGYGRDKVAALARRIAGKC